MTPGGIDELEVLKNRYMTIVMARVSTSAAEAFELGYLESSNASVSISRKWQLEQARRKAMELSDKGYVQPVAREDIRVLGRQGLGMLTVGASNMLAGHRSEEHTSELQSLMRTSYAVFCMT